VSDGESSGARLRPMALDDLEQVRVWRNHPDIRRHMFSQHEISADEHRRWFEQCARDERRHVLIFESQGTASGFVSFHQTAEGGIADWGFYSAPQAARGSGQQLGAAALRHAFERLGFHKVCGRALSGNLPSVKLHRRLGFREEGVLREQHFDGGRYHDVVYFGLLRAEWLERAAAPAAGAP
jgi:UDP-4-amino-4,6-dideoxy-N-acetyl-beta-L-altrosamine N-acetyltransferase